MGGGRGNGVDGRGNQNATRDCRYYIARRTNTTLRIKSRPLGFGWGGEGGMVWMGVGIKMQHGIVDTTLLEGQAQL